MTQDNNNIISSAQQKHVVQTYGCHRTGVAASHQVDKSSRPSLLSGVRLMLAIVASDSWPLVRRKPEAEAKTEAFIDATARTKKVMVSFMMMMVMVMMMMMMMTI